MSTPNRSTSVLNYICQSCGSIDINRFQCSQCLSTLVVEQSMSTYDQQQLDMNTSNEQTIRLNTSFEHIFDMQSLTSMLVPFLMSQAQSDLRSTRHRRSRLPRRIKRITHTHRPMSLVVLPSRHLINAQLRLLHINDFLSRYHLQSEMTRVQMPYQWSLYDTHDNNLDVDLFTQLVNNDMNILPLTRDEIQRLPTVTRKLVHSFVSSSMIYQLISLCST
jgi:hypothetical protein